MYLIYRLPPNNTAYYICDYMSDLNDLEGLETTRPGSKAIVIETSQVFTYSNTDEWKVQAGELYSDTLTGIINSLKQVVESETRAIITDIKANEGIPLDYSELTSKVYNLVKEIGVSNSLNNYQPLINCIDGEIADTETPSLFTWKKAGKLIFLNGAPYSQQNRLCIYGEYDYSTSNPTYNGKPTWYYLPCNSFVIGHRYKFKTHLLSGSYQEAEDKNPENDYDFCFLVGNEEEPSKTYSIKDGATWVCNMVPQMIAFAFSKLELTNVILYLEIIDLTEKEKDEVHLKSQIKYNVLTDKYQVVPECNDAYESLMTTMTKCGNLLYTNGVIPYSNTRYCIYGDFKESSTSPIYEGNGSKPDWYYDPCEDFIIGHEYYFNYKVVEGVEDRGSITSNPYFHLRKKDGTQVMIEEGNWKCTFQPEMIVFNFRKYTYENAIIQLNIIDLTKKKFDELKNQIDNEINPQKSIILPCNDDYTPVSAAFNNFTIKKHKNLFYFNGDVPQGYSTLRLCVYGDLKTASTGVNYEGNQNVKKDWFYDPCEQFILGHTYKFNYKILSGNYTIDANIVTNNVTDHFLTIKNKAGDAVGLGPDSTTGNKDGAWKCTFIPESIYFNMRKGSCESLFMLLAITDITEEVEKIQSSRIPIFELKKKTYTIGHSSGGNAASSNPAIPENSIEGLIEYARQGYWGVSCDIRLTSDNEWILMHDSYLDRTTNIDPDLPKNSEVYPVEQFSLAQIKEYYLRKTWGGYITTYKVPTLKEWLTAARIYGVYCSVQIEECPNLKTEQGALDEEAVYAAMLDIINTIKELNMENQVLLAAFGNVSRYLEVVKSIDPTIFCSIILNSDTSGSKAFIPISQNNGNLPTKIQNIAKYGNVGIGVSQDSPNLSRENVQAYQELGIKVGAWTSYPSTRDKTIEVLPYGFDFYSSEDCIDVMDLIYEDIKERDNPKDMLSMNKFMIGYNYSDGSEALANTRDRCYEIMTNYLEVTPQTVYSFFAWVTTIDDGYWHRYCWYDENYNFISSSQVSRGSVRGYWEERNYVTSPENAKYLRISFRSFLDGVASLYEGKINTVIKPEWYKTEFKSHVTDTLNIKTIAHRCGGHLGPENTMPALLNAAKAGFKFVECDVDFTLETGPNSTTLPPIPVLLHDSSINRTSNGEGNINQMSYNNVALYDFSKEKVTEGGVLVEKWADHPEFIGTKIMTLSEFLTACHDLNLYPYIDMKNTNYIRNNVEIIVNMVKDFGMENSVTFISASWYILSKIKTLCPSARLGLNTDGYNTNTSPPTSDIDWEKVLRICQLLRSETNSVFVNARKQSVNPNHTGHVSGYDILPKNGFPLETWTVYEDDTTMYLRNSLIKGYTAETISYDEYMENKYKGGIYHNISLNISTDSNGEKILNFIDK